MGLAIIVPSISFDDANLGKVTLSGAVPIRDLYINLENSYTGTTVDLKCSYLPAITTQRGVIWSIESGNEYAYVSGSTLTILPDTVASPVTIKCTSVENPAVSSEKTISLTYREGELIIYEGRSIVTDGTAYLDVLEDFTGEKRFNCVASQWEIDFYAPRTSSDIRALFGAATPNPKNPKSAGFTAMIRRTSESDAFQFENINSSTSGIGNRILAKNTNGNITLTVNNEVIKTFTVNINTCETDYLYLGCRLSAQGTAELFASDIQIYGFKLSTKASGEICNLVPCTYEGVVGMYNKTNNKVLLPTSGAFTLV